MKCPPIGLLAALLFTPAFAQVAGPASREPQATTASASTLVPVPVASEQDLDSTGRPVLPSPAPPPSVAGGRLAVGSADSLTTTFTSTHFQAGNMFDIRPNVNLKITSLDVNVDHLGLAAVLVYYREGSSFGREEDPTGWALLTSSVGNGQGLDNPTNIPIIGSDVIFRAGKTYGLFVTDPASNAFNYSSGPNTYANEDLVLTTNCGKGLPLFTGTTFSPRSWNGTVYYETLPTLNVGIVAAANPNTGDCRFTDVRDKLEATGRFNSVEVFNAHQATPTLAELERYDAVLVWVGGDLADADAFGDVLADYHDGGGGVVVGVFANVETNPNRRIGGRWQLGGYEVIVSGSGLTTGNATLGTIVIPGHPLLEGVASFDGGSSSYRPSGLGVTSGSRVVAQWSDGKTLLAVGGPGRVDLGFYPPSADCTSNSWDAATDGDRMLTNALAVASDRRPSVLIASAPGDAAWNDDVRAKLLENGSFRDVDVFNTRSVVPTLTQLLAYDAVLCFSDAPHADAVALGDALADYVDLGGGVVQANFSFRIDPYRLAGRWLSGPYEVILSGLNVTTGRATLGNFLPGHPLMAGVTSFDGGTGSWRSTSTPLNVGATAVALWSDGTVLVAEGLNRQRVDLGFYPPSQGTGRTDFWDPSTDGDKLMVNALLQAAAVSIPARPFSYCTAGTTANGCRASISATGEPSVSATSGFTLTVTGVEGNKNGLIFYGINGPNSTPWGSGSSSYLCVKAPTQRTPFHNSGGTVGQCDGQLALDWLAWTSSHPGKLGTPFAAGCGVWAQGWFRDPPSPRTTSLSNGLQFTTVP